MSYIQTCTEIATDLLRHLMKQRDCLPQDPRRKHWVQKLSMFGMFTICRRLNSPVLTGLPGSLPLVATTLGPKTVLNALRS